MPNIGFDLRLSEQRPHDRVGSLDDGPVQPTLPLMADDGFGLDAAVDAVRERFGASALTRAALLERRPSLEIPLPD